MTFLNVSDTLQDRPPKLGSPITIKSSGSATAPRLNFTFHYSVIGAALWSLEPSRLTVDFNPNGCALRIRRVPDGSERSWLLTMPKSGRPRLSVPIGEGFPLPSDPIRITDAYEIKNGALYIYIPDTTPLFGVHSGSDRDNARALANDVAHGKTAFANVPSRLRHLVIEELDEYVSTR